jgi:TolA-binding protein
MMISKRGRTYIFSLIFSTLLFCKAYGQESALFYEIEKEYKTALHLYDRQQYNAALQHFEDVLKKDIPKAALADQKSTKLFIIQAEYYASVCALELYHQGAELRLMRFVEKYPEHPLSRNASFELGNFYYRQRSFAKAIQWYKKTNIGLLGKAEQTEYQFRLGYSLFESKEFEQASEMFEKVIPKNSKYSFPSAYYEGLIQYDAKNYGEALQRFEFIKDSKTYGGIAPYYIVAIYFKQKNYDQVLSQTAGLNTTIEVKNLADIYLMAGTSAFNKKNWAAAIQNYELAKQKVSISEQAQYELGFAYFQNQTYQKAVDALKVLADSKGPYAQHALYLMGQSFYQLNDKPSARNAFSKAAKLKTEEFITASSLLNYAKLSFELNFYQTAIESLQDYLEKFPNNEEAPEAQSLLAESFLYTRNYKQAVEILSGLKARSTRANLAFQKVSYLRALELYNENKFQDCIAMLNTSLAFPLDKVIETQSFYWKAECNYQLNNIDEAIKYFAMFNSAEVSKQGELQNLSNYQLGYAYFKKEDYKSAIVYFDRFIKQESKSNASNKRIPDALLRLADGYFVIKDYDKALFAYNKIISEKQTGVDYALFQKGMLLGLQGKQNDKIVILKSLLSTYPTSSYADDGIFEIGNGYFLMSNTADASIAFKELIKNYPLSRYVPKSRLSLGLILYADGQDEQAINMYKAIITDYPSTEEAKEALLAIKNIYIDAGNAEAYLNYSATLPFASVSEAAQDSISYQAANNRYLRGDCENAINGLGNYLSKFPNGSFAIEAHAQRADCLMQKKKKEEALVDFEYLISVGSIKYKERSLLQAARISKDLQQYAKAASYYVQLEASAEYKENYAEAIAGAMHAYERTNDTINVLKYTDRVLAYEKSGNEDQYLAHLYKARIYYAKADIENAEQEFAAVSKLTRTEAAAEARYFQALLLFEKGKYLDAQQACFDLSNQVPSYENWVARGFIVLAQTYAKMGNDFQAISTLQSVIDEYGNESDGIIAEAKIKLEELKQSKP